MKNVDEETIRTGNGNHYTIEIEWKFISSNHNLIIKFTLLNYLSENLYYSLFSYFQCHQFYAHNLQCCWELHLQFLSLVCPLLAPTSTSESHSILFPAISWSLIALVDQFWELFYFTFAVMITKSQRQRGREKRDLLSINSLPNWPQQLSLKWSEAWSQDVLLGLKCRLKCPKTSAIFCYFPRT